MCMCSSLICLCSGADRKASVSWRSLAFSSSNWLIREFEGLRQISTSGLKVKCKAKELTYTSLFSLALYICILFHALRSSYI